MALPPLQLFYTGRKVGGYADRTVSDVRDGRRPFQGRGVQLLQPVHQPHGSPRVPPRIRCLRGLGLFVPMLPARALVVLSLAPSLLVVNRGRCATRETVSTGSQPGLLHGHITGWLLESVLHSSPATVTTPVVSRSFP